MIDVLIMFLSSMIIVLVYEEQCEIWGRGTWPLAFIYTLPLLYSIFFAPFYLAFYKKYETGRKFQLKITIPAIVLVFCNTHLLASQLI